MGKHLLAFILQKILEVQVRHYLGRSWSLLGIPLEQVCHQMDGFRAGIWDQCLQIIGNTLRPAEIHRTCQMISVRPIVLEEDTVHRICSILHTQLSQLDVKEELFINETHIHKYVFLCVPQVKNKKKVTFFGVPKTWQILNMVSTSLEPGKRGLRV